MIRRFLRVLAIPSVPAMLALGCDVDTHTSRVADVPDPEPGVSYLAFL